MLDLGHWVLRRIVDADELSGPHTAHVEVGTPPLARIFARPGRLATMLRASLLRRIPGTLTFAPFTIQSHSWDVGDRRRPTSSLRLNLRR
jgi:hypothetical protein